MVRNGEVRDDRDRLATDQSQREKLVIQLLDGYEVINKKVLNLYSMGLMVGNHPLTDIHDRVHYRKSYSIASEVYAYLLVNAYLFLNFFWLF